MLDLSLYKQVYGLSCIENQVLAILADNGFTISYLYGDSIMPLSELFYYTILQNMCFTKPDFMERIQDRLKELGILSFHLYTEPDFTRILQSAQDNNSRSHFLIEVSPEYSKNVLMSRGWRNDHFVLLEQQDKELIIKSDTPSKSLNLTKEQMTNIYFGRYFEMTVNRTLSDKDILQLWKLRKYKPEKYVPFCFCPDDLNGVNNIFPRLRELVMLYKNNRYRMKMYYQNYVDVRYMDEYLSSIEKLQAQIEYCFFRKQTDRDQAFAFLTALNNIETEIMNSLKKRIKSI